MKFNIKVPTMSRSRSGRDSTSSTTSSRYGTSAKSSNSSYTPGSYGSSSTSTYSSGYGHGGYGGTSGYESSYTGRTPSYGSGLGSTGLSTYGSSYTSPYSSTPSYNAGSSYGSSYSTVRSASRDFDISNSSSTSTGPSSTISTISNIPTYSSRATRDRSSERSYDSLYSTPRNPRRSKGDLFSRTGLRKSSSYSGLHWMHQEPVEKKHSLINVNEIIYKSHRRTGSNSSLSSDGVFEDGKSVSRSREGSQKSSKPASKPPKPQKRDLEAILGRDDHILVQRIIEENKELIEETHALTSQEEKLIQKIMEASISGGSLDCLDVLTIIESH